VSDTPAPPEVGEKLYRAWGKGTSPEPFEVRAIVDLDTDARTYQVVLRVGSDGQGWLYRLESEAAFITGLYRHERRDPDTGLVVPA
jgi:hypothetical protein